MSVSQKDLGAPLGLYLLLESAGEPELIDREVPAGAEILELGCGTGRITHRLIELGRRVVAVDMDEEMLAHVHGAETVCARIEELDLGRFFGGVLLMSNLVNTSDDAKRAALLRTCREHVAPNGVVLIERYDPESGTDPTPVERTFAGIVIRVSDIRREGQLLYETIEYDAGERGRWQIRLDGARILSDDDALAALGVAGLRLLRWVGPERRWLVAAPL